MSKGKLVLPPGIELYSWFERFMDWWLGCRHNWGFPFRSRGMEYPHPYDAHQTCNVCGKSRFYQFQGVRTDIEDVSVHVGPLFRVLIDSERGLRGV